MDPQNANDVSEPQSACKCVSSRSATNVGLRSCTQDGADKLSIERNEQPCCAYPYHSLTKHTELLQHHISCLLAGEVNIWDGPTTFVRENPETASLKHRKLCRAAALEPPCEASETVVPRQAASCSPVHADHCILRRCSSLHSCLPRCCKRCIGWLAQSFVFFAGFACCCPSTPCLACVCTQGSVALQTCHVAQHGGKYQS
jgi:hypothetical protein